MDRLPDGTAVEYDRWTIRGVYRASGTMCGLNVPVNEVGDGACPECGGKVTAE